MYLIKPNGSYNIVINDIGVTISFPNTAVIEKSKYEKSGDIQKLLNSGIILVKELKENETSKVEIEAKTEEEKIFVAREEETKSASNVFVRQPEKVNVDEPKATKKLEKEEKVEVPVVEEKVEIEKTETEKAEVEAESKTDKEVKAKEVTPKSTNKRNKK